MMDLVDAEERPRRSKMKKAAGPYPICTDAWEVKVQSVPAGNGLP